MCEKCAIDIRAALLLSHEVSHKRTWMYAPFRAVLIGWEKQGHRVRVQRSWHRFTLLVSGDRRLVWFGALCLRRFVCILCVFVDNTDSETSMSNQWNIAYLALLSVVCCSTQISQNDDGKPWVRLKNGGIRTGFGRPYEGGFIYCLLSMTACL